MKTLTVAHLSLLSTLAAAQLTTTINSFDVLQTLPHDTNAFTQGLTFDPSDGSVVYESTGLFGQSDVRRVDIANGDVLLLKETPSDIFGEGLAFYDADKLIHITWKSQRGFVLDATTLDTMSEFTFETQQNEGWGITYQPDSHQFLVTDGTEYLHFWNADTLQEESRIAVTMQLDDDDLQPPQAVSRLNEIEWDAATHTVLANVWQTDWIVRINPSNGRVTHRYDLSQLYLNRAASADVLNGIAIAPNQDLWVTGKKWPYMFRIQLGTEPDTGSGGGSGSGPSGGFEGCFSATSTVQMWGKGPATMEQLKVGDKVQTTMDGQYEAVYAFGHYAPSTKAEFLQITFAKEPNGLSSTLQVTGEHLVYLNGMSNPVRADSVAVGDVLQGSSSSSDRMTVQSIRKVQRTGLYAPLTPGGTLVVDGVQASNYIALQQSTEFVKLNGGANYWISHHNLAHWGLAPLRLVCTSSILGTTKRILCQSYNDQGLLHYISGGIHLAKYLDSLQLHYVLQVFLFGVTFATMGCFVALEQLGAVGALTLLITVVVGRYAYTASRLRVRMQIKTKQR